MTYNSQQTSEKLFLNTIRFEMPNTPVICYFSLEDIKGFHLKQLNIKNMPVGIETIFPGLKKNQLIYTSFCEPHEGMFSLEVNLNTYFGDNHPGISVITTHFG